MKPINWADVVAQQQSDMDLCYSDHNDLRDKAHFWTGHRTGFEDCAKWLQENGYIVLEDVK